MVRKETLVQRIARLTAKQFPGFGSPGIDLGVMSPAIEQVVQFVLTKRNAIAGARRRRQYHGDDARDYANTSYFLRPLSNRALSEISHLGRGDIHRHLKEKKYPFSRLNKKARETLLHLPNSWVHGAADWLLEARKLRSREQAVLAD